MRTLRFVMMAACPLAALAVSAAAVAQTEGRSTRPAAPARPNAVAPQYCTGPQAPYTILATPSATVPRVSRTGQYPMPIARTDVARFNMPVTAGDPSNYPIRIVRPEGEAIAYETAPPVGVPVDPKLLEPVSLKYVPARPSLSK